MVVGAQVTQLQKQRANLEARLTESNNKIRMLKADLYAPHGYQQCASRLAADCADRGVAAADYMEEQVEPWPVDGDETVGQASEKLQYNDLLAVSAPIGAIVSEAGSVQEAFEIDMRFLDQLYIAGVTAKDIDTNPIVVSIQ